MTRKVKAAKRSEGGRAVQGGRAAAPIVASNLALVMREVYEFWTGAPVADAALREYRALLAVAKAAGSLDLGVYLDERGRWHVSEDAGRFVVDLGKALARLARASRTEGGRP
jgi:hypothetical protein